MTKKSKHDGGPDAADKATAKVDTGPGADEVTFTFNVDFGDGHNQPKAGSDPAPVPVGLGPAADPAPIEPAPVAEPAPIDDGGRTDPGGGTPTPQPSTGNPVEGTDGADQLKGTVGNDVIAGGKGADAIDLSAGGADTVVYAPGDAPMPADAAQKGATDAALDAAVTPPVGGGEAPAAPAVADTGTAAPQPSWAGETVLGFGDDDLIDLSAYTGKVSATEPGVEVLEVMVSEFQGGTLVEVGDPAGDAVFLQGVDVASLSAQDFVF